jgi:drug/metabolite transporter (DMT)-like permease
MKTTFLFTLVILGYGVGAFLMVHVGRAMDLGTILVCNLIGYAITIALLARGPALQWTWDHFLAVLVAVLFVMANYAYYRLSHAKEQVTILAPLTSLYVLVTVGLGVIFMHESMTWKKGLGIALAVVALILLSWDRGAGVGVE